MTYLGWSESKKIKKENSIKKYIQENTKFQFKVDLSDILKIIGITHHYKIPIFVQK